MSRESNELIKSIKELCDKNPETGSYAISFKKWQLIITHIKHLEKSIAEYVKTILYQRRLIDKLSKELESFKSKGE